MLYRQVLGAYPGTGPAHQEFGNDNHRTEGGSLQEIFELRNLVTSMIWNAC
jgi:hypothetical protein